jgi:hypothetical protein
MQSLSLAVSLLRSLALSLSLSRVLFLSLSLARERERERERYIYIYIWCVRCLLITESPKTPSHYRYQIYIFTYICVLYDSFACVCHDVCESHSRCDCSAFESLSQRNPTQIGPFFKKRPSNSGSLQMWQPQQLARVAIACLIHMRDMVYPHVWHDSFICVTWLIYVCDKTHSCVCAMTRARACCGSSMSSDWS